MVSKKIELRRKIRCFNCRILGRKCLYEDNNKNCTVCIKRNQNCIRVYPKNFKHKIIELSDEAFKLKEENLILKNRIAKLEKNELIIKQNLVNLLQTLELKFEDMILMRLLKFLYTTDNRTKLLYKCYSSCE